MNIFEQAHFVILAHEYAAAPKECKLATVGKALQAPGLQEFIDIYKDGWLGQAGEFARVVSRAVQAVE